MAELKPLLLVEDSANDLELTLAALAEIPLENQIEVARDGAEALDYIFRRGAYENRTSLDPAVILLDLKLPKIDGLEVLARVKGDPGTRNLPIVVLTSSREESDIVRSYNLGVNAFVVKPLGFKDFFEVIRDLGIFWTSHNEAPGSGAWPSNQR